MKYTITDGETTLIYPNKDAWTNAMLAFGSRCPASILKRGRLTITAGRRTEVIDYGRGFGWYNVEGSGLVPDDFYENH